MNFLKRIVGKCIYGLAKLVEFTMNTVISGIELVINLIKGFFKGFLILLSMGGCLLFFVLLTPLGIRLILDPSALFIFILLMVFPILGVRFIEYIKYVRFITTEYLYNTSSHFISGLKYRPFKAYKEDYIRAKREAERRERERQYQQQKAWEERFRQQWSGFGQSGDFRGSGQTSFGYDNSTSKRRESLELLGVSSEADANEIKSAYRKLAKKYHPDVNKEPDAKEKFQRVTEAYEFLTR